MGSFLVLGASAGFFSFIPLALSLASSETPLLFAGIWRLVTGVGLAALLAAWYRCRVFRR